MLLSWGDAAEGSWVLATVSNNCQNLHSFRLEKTLKVIKDL